MSVGCSRMRHVACVCWKLAKEQGSLRIFSSPRTLQSFCCGVDTDWRKCTIRCPPPPSLPFISFGSWDVALGALNTAFVAIFAVEAGLKVVAFGLKPCVANRFFSRRCPQLLDWAAHKASPSHSSLWLTSSPTRTRIPFYDQ